MLSKYHRWIQYYDLFMQSSPPESPAVKLTDLVDPLIRHFESGDAKQLLNHDTAICRIAKIQHDQERNALVLLLQFADKNVSEPAFLQLTTGTVRVSEKDDEEGIAVSAHIIISLVETKPDTQSYLFLAEQVPGLHRTLMQRFLRHEFREISDAMNLTFIDMQGREKSRRPLPQLTGYPSTPLQEALETGILKEFSFVKHIPNNQDIDNPAYVREEVRKTTLKIDSAHVQQDKFDIVRTLLRRARSEDAQNIRVKFKDVDADREHTISLDETDDQMRIVKSDKVQLNTPIGTCEDHLHGGIIEQMFLLLARMRE